MLMSCLLHIFYHSTFGCSVGLGRVLEACSVKPVDSIISLRTLARTVGERPTKLCSQIFQKHDDLTDFP